MTFDLIALRIKVWSKGYAFAFGTYDGKISRDLNQGETMKKLSRISAAALSAATFAVAMTAPMGAAHAQQKFMTIGTGGVTGVYYAAGGAMPFGK